jgi:hypothetical protein
LSLPDAPAYQIENVWISFWGIDLCCRLCYNAKQNRRRGRKFTGEEESMSVRRMLIVALIAVTLLTTAGMGPGIAAQSLAQEDEGATIPYAGRLTGDGGEVVADGAYDLQFALYAAQTGGDPLWTETQTGVAVRGGAFGVVLGSATPIPKALLEGDARWLAVSVRGPAESVFTLLEPRQRLSAVAPSAADSVGCPHDHFDEWWQGTSASAGLVVDNSTGTGDGIRGYANAANANYGGVYGVNFSSGPGVYGRSEGGGPGVAGYSGTRGVYGKAADGVVGESNVNAMSGVYGFNTAATGYGVTGRAESYFGVFAWGNDGSLYDTKGDILLQGSYGEIFAYGTQLDIFSNRHVIVDLDDDNNDSGAFFSILSGTDGTLWTISETKGDAVAVGSHASAVTTADGGQRLMYAIEGAGVWLEDVGTAALADGRATITFDPAYAQTANVGQEYQVFLTAQSDQPVLLYVASKTATGFTVGGATLDGQPANCAFDYRVVAPRLGYEDVRTEEYTPSVKEQP